MIETQPPTTTKKAMPDSRPRYDQSSHRDRHSRHRDDRRRSRSPSRRSDTQLSRRDQPRQTHMSRAQQQLEDKQAQKWVAGEDEFALKQMKHGAMIRVKENRARPIDWLAANLKMIEADAKSVYDDLEFDEAQEFEMPVPFAIVEELEGMKDVRELVEDIEEYEKVDTRMPNKEFWQMMRVLCMEKQNQLGSNGSGDNEDRVIEPVSDDIDAVLKDKTYGQLIQLEDQIHSMLEAKDSVVDVDFWTRLLKELVFRKAKSKLQEIHKLIISERVRKLQKVQTAEALRAKLKISSLIKKGKRTAAANVPYDPAMDIVPPLISFKQFEDIGVTIKHYTKDSFFTDLDQKRNAVRKLGFVAMKQQKDRTAYVASEFKSIDDKTSIETDPAQALYDKELARATGENEETFVSETPLPASTNPGLTKPRYFNRVMLGYEWSKYNQTHFTSENPPPKVVQGYKFNIFYPDLINAQKAPSYKIIRDAEGKSEKHRVALAAGESDTCIIKFTAHQQGYQDIAFRIVDKQWDNSSHRGAGFKSKFENGVLQLHFRFKKVFYRK